ncbi:MAG: histidinol-phosphate transaminase [Myxococcota bacterium]
MSGTRSKTPGPQPMAALAEMSGYRATRSPIPAPIRLDGNEGRLPPPHILAAVERAGPEVLRRYPNKATLEARLAKRAGVAPENLLVANGADDALDRIARAYVGTGRSLVTAGPTFEMIERFVTIAGGRFIEVPWWSEPFPLEAIRSAVEPNTSAIAAVTPNNPTGLSATYDEVAALATEYPDRLIVADLAYAEFANEDLTPRLLAHDNVVITRTLSKAWSLAGARVGYVLAGNRSLIDHLRNAGGPFPVSGPSLAIAEAWLDAGLDHVTESRTAVLAERSELAGLLERLGAQPFPSQANYVCARYRDVQWVYDAVASTGIAIRAFTDKPKLRDCARITCPQDRDVFERLSRALVGALAPKGICVDKHVDGVDVGALRAAGITVQVADAPEPYGWWIGLEPTHAGRERGAVTFVYGMETEDAQRGGSARAFTSTDEIIQAWKTVGVRP